MNQTGDRDPTHQKTKKEQWNKTWDSKDSYLYRIEILLKRENLNIAGADNFVSTLCYAEWPIQSLYVQYLRVWKPTPVT